MSALELRGLTKLHPGGRGVRDLDLVVEEGEIFGFIGRNGAGKSTTIRTLLGFLRPTRGAATLLGHDVRQGRSARREVGYVPSEPGLYEDLTVAAMLAYLGSLHAVDTSRRRAALCEALDLDPSRRCEDLSLGNKKKVALVAALQHAPRLLILDEPTSGLDPLVQARLHEVLREEQARGATVFFSSHVLSEVQRLCGRVALVEEGRIVEIARVDDLRASRTRRVRVVYADGASEKGSLALDGVADLRRDGAAARFLYEGDHAALLAALVKDGVVDVTIEEPSLEEIVMGRYGGDGGARA